MLRKPLPQPTVQRQATLFCDQSIGTYFRVKDCIQLLLVLSIVILIDFRLKAKKSFGQHFLINEPLSEKIAHSLLMDSDTRNVLEIGPGKGVLTKYLLQQDINLKVVEADKDMVAYLESNHPKLEGNIIFLVFLNRGVTLIRCRHFLMSL